MSAKIDETYLLGEMTTDDAKRKFARCDVAILPVGSLEQHGHHLPLDTDTFDVYWLSQEVAKRTKPPRPTVCPPINYGVSYHHMDFPGTISISSETLTNMIYEICISLIQHGVNKVLILNGHGGNIPALSSAAIRVNTETNAFICIDTGNVATTIRHKLMKTKNDVHAGECETSTSLANREHLVRMNKIRKPTLKFYSKYLQFGSDCAIFKCRIKDISNTGVIGDPTKATKQKGTIFWATVIKNLVELIEHLKKMKVTVSV
jgi:creatinine amidohydrolase/Fe(II)-dependent formamide hydrolase-like protein